MNRIFTLLSFLFFSINHTFSQDTAATHTYASVLVIPYMPAMHLSDADVDIADGSQMEIPEMRSALRMGLVKQLNKNFAEIYNMNEMQNDFVKGDNNNLDALYHSVVFQRDSVYTLKFPKKFAVKDTAQKKKTFVKVKPEVQYINAEITDELLIPDLSKRFDADYFIFLNELDIKTHSEDCINLAMKIYRRDLKVHYTIFDKQGKQLYGDVAVANFDSNSNDVNNIMKKNFPAISEYILGSLNKVAK